VRDLHRHQALVAQPADDLALVGGVELANGDLARRIDGTVTIDGPRARPAC
jgi:hypothetical protein